MKRVSTATAAQSRNISQQKLTIGLDLGDRNSCYCVVDEAGQIQLEQRVRTSAKALQEVFGATPRSRVALEIGTHSPWISRLLSELGHEVIVANARKVRLIGENRKKDDRLDAQTSYPQVKLLKRTTPPARTPEAMTLMRETIEIAFLTVIQLLTPEQRAALILCDVLDWSAKDAADLLDLSVPAVNSALQRARVRLRERLPSRKPPWPTNVDASAAERDLLKKYVEASESADFRAFESIIRKDATFRMPPEPGVAEGREAMFKLWIEGGFGSEQFGRLRCVLTHANLQPAVAAYVCRPGDSIWRAMALDVLRIEDGLITEIVVFPPHTFPAFSLPMMMDAPPEMNKCH